MRPLIIDKPIMCGNKVQKKKKKSVIQILIAFFAIGAKAIALIQQLNFESYLLII